MVESKVTVGKDPSVFVISIEVLASQYGLSKVGHPPLVFTTPKGEEGSLQVGSPPRTEIITDVSF